MNDHHDAVSSKSPHRAGWGLAVAVSFVMILVSCRVPDPPVIKNKSSGIIYDTAMEEELRSGRAHALMQSSMARYIDTLSESPAVTEWSDDGSRWDVFVSTNRGWFENPGDPESANEILDEPQFGRCEVSLPRQKRGDPMAVVIKQDGQIINTASTRKKPADDSATAVVTSESLGESSFLEGINDQVERSRQQDVLIFVHGFNVPFESAVASAARLALDIPFNGAVVAYCWPSQGGVRNYQKDEPINLASVEPFTQFLVALRRGVPEGTRIHIVVHSMGNRIVMQSLNRLPDPGSQKPFANVVLCAPDVGHRDFKEWAPGVVAQAERVTLYANQSDTALIASKGVHSEKRAGDAWIPVILDGVETVDCSRIDFSLMGHSYFSENTDVLGDLFMLVKEDLPASRRPHLDKLKDGKQIYWQFARTAPVVYYAWHYDD